MEFIRKFTKPLIPFISICFLSLSFQNTAMSEMISTETIVKDAQAKQQRSKLRTFYNRTEVRAALHKKGLTVSEAKARIASLSDTEVQLIVNKIDTLPAGAGGETFLLLLLLIIVLEATGVTNIFTFI